MISVGSREAVELQTTHQVATNHAVKLSRHSLFGRKPTLEDLQGICIIYMWIHDVRSPGQAVTLAHELKITSTCAKLFAMATRSEELTADTSRLLYSMLRTYGYLYQIDIL